MVRGKENGLSRVGCTSFRTDARKVLLSPSSIFALTFSDQYQGDEGRRFRGPSGWKTKSRWRIMCFWFAPSCIGRRCARCFQFFERPIIEESKLVLRIERQLDHALEKLIPGNAAKISQHELLDIEPYEIAQFERLDTRGEHEIAMAVVHDDHVARRIEAGAP